MNRTPTFRNLAPLDITVLRDLVRFGVLTGDQIARRYFDPHQAPDRIRTMIDGGWVVPWQRLIQDTDIFSATSSGARVARCGLRSTRPSLEHLRHDIALVDLADYLVAHEPDAVWRTERELRRVLRPAATPAPRRWPAAAGAGHRPDGLLLLDGQVLAIELEHTDKGDQRYATICRWFALNTRVDGVRWYVDDEKIIARIRRVNAQHGFAEDVDVTYAPFPPGVVMRQWRRP